MWLVHIGQWPCVVGPDWTVALCGWSRLDSGLAWSRLVSDLVRLVQIGQWPCVVGPDWSVALCGWSRLDSGLVWLAQIGE